MKGQRFGRLLVVEEAEKSNGQRRWHCACDCGEKRIVFQSSLRRGAQSCGCLKAEQTAQRWAQERSNNALFWAKVDKSGICWEWTAAKSPVGYGLYGSGAFGERLAHRESWRICHGNLPDGMHVLHRCDNPSCVNPNHLFLGKHADNMLDMKKKSRRKNICAGEKNGRAKLNYEKAQEIRKVYSQGRSQQSIADQYGISQQQISKVVRNITFTEPQ